MQQLKCVLQAGQAELRNGHRIQCQYTKKTGWSRSFPDRHSIKK